jgi:polyhydroxyalkanoate synthesis regulator phasin
MKQTLKIGVTVLVVATLAMSGIALAQTDDSTDEYQQNAVTRIAEKLQALVDDGTISSDQAEAVAEFLAAQGPIGRGGPGGRHGNFGAIAEFLGMEPDEFRAALQEYDTLADLADANGSSASALIEFLVGQAEDRIAQAVENGRLTQDEADEKIAELTDNITEHVNNPLPEDAGQGRPGGRRGPGGAGAEGGFGGQPTVDVTA